MINKYTLALIAMIFMLLSYNLLSNEAFAASHTFARQVVIDELNDLSLVKSDRKSLNVTAPDGSIEEVKIEKNEAECKKEQNYIRSPDIRQVSYFSDGKILSATLWLNRTFNEIPIYRTLYAMGVDIQSIYDTIPAGDYQVRIIWDVTNQNWTRTVEEIPPAGRAKILEKNENYTGFFEKGGRYVELSVDLDSISSPHQYNLLFYIMDYYIIKHNHFCHLIDISSRAYVPIPDFTIRTSPNTLELRPGEEKTIEVQVESITDLKSKVMLFADSTNGIELAIIIQQ